jgi:hypothetical protein
MKKALLVWCLAGTAVWAFSRPVAGGQNRAPDKVQPKVTLTGKLEGGKVAIGGETTGWTLTYRDTTGEHTIEVELSPGLRKKVLGGETVRIAGTMETRERVERGKVSTLVATTLDVVPPVK